MDTRLKMVTEHDVIKAFSHVIDKTKAKKLKEYENGFFVDCLHITKERIEFTNCYFIVFYNFSQSEKEMNEEAGLFEVQDEYNVRLADFETFKNDKVFENTFSKMQFEKLPNVEKIIQGTNIDGNCASFDVDYIMNYLKFCKALKIKDKPVTFNLAKGKNPSRLDYEQTAFYVMPVYREEVRSATA